MLFAFRWVRRLISFVVLAVLAVLLWTAGSIWWTARQDTRPTSDAIVVLGAAQFDGRPSSVLKA
ncbi:MAG: YdcF family protein, partial [Candidatus Limnocylindrales bacterium]